MKRTINYFSVLAFTLLLLSACDHETQIHNDISWKTPMAKTESKDGVEKKEEAEKTLSKKSNGTTEVEDSKNTSSKSVKAKKLPSESIRDVQLEDLIRKVFHSNRIHTIKYSYNRIDLKR
jgi:hypothetical protein